MPTTVNGVGTHYYGKSNETSRIGVCKACGATVRLDSYDTRLWFVVVFVPIIPLGRKRITDQCSRCRRHWVASKAAFEAAKRESITAAMEQYEKQPSPESALQLHGSLLAFRQYDKAEPFRGLAMEQYADKDLLFRGLAVQMDQLGAPEQANPFFEKAFALRPDLPEICIGAADARIADGHLDEARKLLKPLETPGAAKTCGLGRLEGLARAYQRAGRHAETLELCKHLLTESPRLGQIRQFRKLVAVSEKALGCPESALPRQSFSLRGLFSGKSGRYEGWQRLLVFGGAALAIAAIVLAATNEYWRRHRQVFIVNDTGRPIQVTIDDLPPAQVASLTRLQLAEGKHHVKLSGTANEANEAFDLDMQTGYFTRWTDNPAWVIGADGTAALVLSTLHYAVNPRSSQHRLVLVERLYHLPHVDYAFETPPRTIEVDDHGGEKIKTHLERANLPAVAVFAEARQQDHAAALRFAEARLRRNRDDSALIEAYETAAAEDAQMERARQFFQAGLADRPLSVVWHRAYQDMSRNAKQESQLAGEYDALLKKEPESAALLYLRGRVDDDHVKGQEFFRRACRADAALAWPWMALAYDAASSADWPKAREMADKAVQLKLNYSALHQIRHAARLATGGAAAVESECRRIIESGQPGESLVEIIELCDALAVQGKNDAARQAMTQWANRIPDNPAKVQIVSMCQQVGAYLLGDRAASRQIVLTQPGQLLPYFHFQTLLAAGKPQEAATDATLRPLLEEPWNALALSMAYSLSGSPTEAAKWREKACAGLTPRDTDSRRAAALLRGKRAPTPKQLDEVVLTTNVKVLLVAALVIEFPEQKSELAALARRLNVSHMPPYQLVKKAVDAEP